MKVSESTLEELGTELCNSKLAVDNLQEEKKAAFNAPALVGGQWMDDSLVDSCQICDREFNITRRKVRKKS